LRVGSHNGETKVIVGGGGGGGVVVDCVLS